MVSWSCCAADLSLEPAFAVDTQKIIFTDAAAESSYAMQLPDPATADGASADSSHQSGAERLRRSLNLVIYGFSYHTDREGVRREKLDNEFNVGLGLNYQFFEDNQGIGFVEAGFYHDSGRTWAKLAGAGYQFKIGSRLRFGGWLVGLQSPSYFHGKFFIAPLPIVTYDLGRVKLNAIYIPRYRNYNHFAAFGLTFSIPFGE